jgi:hypothetical protein
MMLNKLENNLRRDLAVVYQLINNGSLALWRCFLKRPIAFLFALMAVCCLAPILQSQTINDPPKQMHLCANGQCENVTWTGDHYEGIIVGHTELGTRYWVTAWNENEVKLTSKSAKPVGGVYPIEGWFTGKISKQGGSIVGGNIDWRIGYDKSGSMPFTLTWASQPSNKAEGVDIATTFEPRRSTQHPNILLPPGASEAFASFTSDVRAVLQPEAPLTRDDAKLPCNATAKVTDAEALEIGKYALRAADFVRGRCWINRSAQMGNLRARAIRGLASIQAWGMPQDANAAFDDFEYFNSHPDAWGLYFLKECYARGVGTPVNTKAAGNIEMWFFSHEAGQAVYLAIGADDEEQIRAYKRSLLLINPPMKSSEVCNYNAPKTEQPCHAVTEVDQDRLNTQLKQANQP